MYTVELFINREWKKGTEYFEVSNPATGEAIGRAAKASETDVLEAIASAKKAFKLWSEFPAEKRAALLKKGAVAVKSRMEEIAEILTVEQGKPLKKAQEEVKFSAQVMEFYAEEALRLRGEINYFERGRMSLVVRQPAGVIAAIPAWNFPLALTSWKIGPALAAGCTIVLKPPQKTPLCVVEFAKAFIEDNDMPPGVLNIITGDAGIIGKILCKDDRIAKIALTGSTETGRIIMGEASSTVKSLTLELGNHGPMIVAKKADLDKAVNDGIHRCFSNSGQICHSINRILVHKDIYEEFMSLFVEGTKKITVDDGLKNPDADMGPLTNVDILKKVESHVQDALEKGAKLLYGGKRLEGKNRNGLFFPPTVLADVKEDMKIAFEETFGPVAPIMKYEGLDEAIRIANSTRYGLVAYVYAQDLGESLEIARKLNFGSVGINNVSVVTLRAPFGGWKQSGIGTELSHYGIEFYTNLKHILARF